MYSPTRILLLAALVLGVFLVTGPLVNAAYNVPFFVKASTDEGGGSDESGNEDNNDSDNGEEGGGDSGEGDEEPEPPEPAPEPTPSPEPVPTPAPITEPPTTALVEPEEIQCPEGFVLDDMDQCVSEPVDSLTYTPPPGCEDLTPLECLGEKIGAPPPECENLTPLECLEDYLGKEPTPLPTQPPEDQDPLPYCDKVPDDYTGSCHDRKDFDDVTGLYPCNDGSQEEDWRDCPDATEPPNGFPSPDPGEYYCQALGCPGSPPDPVNGCFDGRNPVDGFCPEPEPEPPLPPCVPDSVSVNANAEREPECRAPEDKPGENYEPVLPNVDDLDCKDIDGTVIVRGQDPYRLDGNGNGIGCEANENGNGNGNGDDDEDINVTINRIVKIVKDNNNHGHDKFPEIDIIGLSTKASGDSMVCLMNIDDSWVQCQEFGMPSDRVNGEFWRIIETDHDKDYDNGNTGSNNVDLAIEDIKAHDFEELDDDRDNHDFGIDLAWIAINPVGEGVACLSEDSTGKGKSLCEPFKVDSSEIDGQITEGVAIS